MNSDDLDEYESGIELQLYQEYRQVQPMFRFVVETERRFYLANEVETVTHASGPIELSLTDAWVWDMYRSTPTRFVGDVKVLTFRDVNIEEVSERDIDEVELAELRGLPPG